MTRTECEAKLMELMEAMVSVLHEYNPKCEYLSCSYNTTPQGERHISISNDCFKDAVQGIGCFKIGDGPIYSYTEFM